MHSEFIYYPVHRSVSMMQFDHWQRFSTLFGNRVLIVCIAILCLLLIVGGPIAIIVAAVLMLLMLFAIERPMPAFYSVIAIQLVVPIYLTIPPLGFLPNLPVGLIPLGGILFLCALETIFDPRPIRLGYYGHILLILFSLFAGITVLSLSDEQTTRETILTWIRAIAIPASIFWLALRKLRNERDVHTLLLLLIGVGVVTSGYAVLEFAMGQNIIIEKLIMASDDSMQDTMSHFYLPSDKLSQFGTLIYRCFSVFISPLEFGSFLTMVFPFPLICAVNASGKWRWLYSLMTLACLIGILLTFSRGPALTAFVQIGFLAILLPPLRRLMLTAVLSMAIVAALAWPIVGGYISERLESADNVTLRFKLWEIGTHVFLDHPLLGVGVGNFPKYQNPTERTYRVGPIVEAGGKIDHVMTVDNTYIQLAAETGLLGTSTFLAAMTVFFVLIAKLYQRAKHTHDILLANLALGIGFGVFGYLFNGLTLTAYVFLVATPTLLLLCATAMILERNFIDLHSTNTSRSCV